MNKVVCPHCQAEQAFQPHPPRDMAVVMGCPSCQELMVLFRDKVIGINRKILESGSREERKAHLAEVVVQFLDEIMESGFLGGGQAFPMMGTDGVADSPPAGFAPDNPPVDRPISQAEFDRFLKIDLKCIDNPSYFRRHFG